MVKAMNGCLCILLLYNYCFYYGIIIITDVSDIITTIAIHRQKKEKNTAALNLLRSKHSGTSSALQRDPHVSCC